ncbi:hypothetical protein KSS87_016498, partial [Heliosperma pusillum]
NIKQNHTIPLTTSNYLVNSCRHCSITHTGDRPPPQPTTYPVILPVVLSPFVNPPAKSYVAPPLSFTHLPPQPIVGLPVITLDFKITGQSCPLLFKGRPYWMAPEVRKNTGRSSLVADIWSLGCTV